MRKGERKEQTETSHLDLPRRETKRTKNGQEENRGFAKGQEKMREARPQRINSNAKPKSTEPPSKARARTRRHGWVGAGPGEWVRWMSLSRALKRNELRGRGVHAAAAQLETRPWRWEPAMPSGDAREVAASSSKQQQQAIAAVQAEAAASKSRSKQQGPERNCCVALLGCVHYAYLPTYNDNDNDNDD